MPSPMRAGADAERRLDIVIGVVFVWFVMSVVLAGIGEGLSLASRLRAKHLWLGVARLTDAGKTPLPRTFADVAIKVPFGSRRDVRPKALASPGEALAERQRGRREAARGSGRA